MESGQSGQQVKTTQQPGEATPLAEAAFYSPAAQSADGKVMVGQDIEIYPEKPCDHFASYETRAFEAKDRRQTGDQFAILCGRQTVPRVTNIPSYRNLRSPYIMRLIDAGVVFWKPEARQRFALVFDKPPGKKLLQSAEAQPYKISEDRIVPALIQPAVEALAQFRNAEIVHGGINPENIFVTGSPGAESIILGECLSSAPSFRQHALFETIERGMADRSARGQGTMKDDLYALGICVAMAIRGENLMMGRNARQIIYDKIETGTYSLVIGGGSRLPSGLGEFLRGVLNDDPAQRWDIDDALGWLEGRRLSPKQPRVNVHAARPFIYRDRKFWDLRSVSMAFAEDPADAAAAMEKDQFDLWIKRNFEDKQLNDRIEKVHDREKGGSKERLVSSIIMALDPRGPVRYKNISAYPAGFGAALAGAIARDEDLSSYAEIIQQQFFNNWIQQRYEEVPDAAGLLTAFEKCRGYLTQKIPGYGIERALYTLNKEAACMSPLFKKHFVLGAGSFIMALEAVSGMSNRPDSVLDRHMIAFLSVREPKLIDPYLGHITSQDRTFQLIGIVRTLAGIQSKFSIPQLPGIGNWLISMINPAIARFNDRDLREEIAKRMNKLVDTGNLQAILELIDDMRIVQDDMARFVMARREFAQLANEKAELENVLKKKKNFGYATGRQVAMLISAGLSVIGIFGYIVFHLAGGL